MYFKNSKKAVHPIIATALLLIVVVVSAVLFQTWFQTFQSGLIVDIEQKSSIENLRVGIENLLDEELYINAGNGLNITRVTIDGNDCNFTGVVTGIDKINVSSCLENLSTNTPNVVVVTNSGVLTKKIFVGEIINSNSTIQLGFNNLNYINISTCVELQAIENNLSANYQLINNIDCSDTFTWNSGSGFLPIGNYSIIGSFSGILNGNNYTISNLYINSVPRRVGIFSYVVEGEIKDLNLNNISVYGNDWYTGGLIGDGYSSLVKNVHFINSYVTGISRVGGILGGDYSNIDIIGSSFQGIVNGTGDSIGGLVGINFEGLIFNSFFNGTVFGVNRVGGLTGWGDYNGYILNSFSKGEIIASGDNVGGLIGSRPFYIKNSYSFMNITGNNNVGGLIGLSGYAEIISNSYFAGSINAMGPNVGGIVGAGIGISTYENLFWNIETSNVLTSPIGTGKTTSELQDINTFTDLTTEGLSKIFDFQGTNNNDIFNINIWDISPGINHGYPYLVYNIDINSLFTSGSGSNEDPFLISNCIEFYNLRVLNYRVDLFLRDEVFVELNNNINCEESSFWNQGLGFTKIPLIFIDLNLVGNNFTINNILMNFTEEDYVSLFDVESRFITSLNLNNINFKNISIYGNNSVGSLNSRGIDNLIIENLSLSDSLISGNSIIGGLVGQVFSPSSSSFSLNYISIENLTLIGGNYVGGVAGRFTSFGTNSFLNYISIKNLTVIGNDYVGGITGWGGTINNSYSIGSITGNNYVGGISGFQSSSSNFIANSYSASIVNGNNFVGGIIYNTSQGSVINSYYDSNVSSLFDFGRGEPRTTQEMRQQTTFTNWDFTNIWQINENIDYPKFIWE